MYKIYSQTERMQIMRAPSSSFSSSSSFCCACFEVRNERTDCVKSDDSKYKHSLCYDIEGGKDPRRREKRRHRHRYRRPIAIAKHAWCLALAFLYITAVRARSIPNSGAKGFSLEFIEKNKNSNHISASDWKKTSVGGKFLLGRRNLSMSLGSLDSVRKGIFQPNKQSDLWELKAGSSKREKGKYILGGSPDDSDGSDDEDDSPDANQSSFRPGKIYISSDAYSKGPKRKRTIDDNDYSSTWGNFRRNTRNIYKRNIGSYYTGSTKQYLGENDARNSNTINQKRYQQQQQQQNQQLQRQQVIPESDANPEFEVENYSKLAYYRGPDWSTKGDASGGNTNPTESNTLPHSSDQMYGMVSGNNYWQQLRVYQNMRHALEEDEKDRNMLITWVSGLKVGAFVVTGLILSYLAVAPTDLPVEDYNYQFKCNFLLLGTSLLGPLLLTLYIFNPRHANINDFIDLIVAGSTKGYLASFLLEIGASTLTRLGVYMLLEKRVFSLKQDIPVIYLPWVLKNVGYEVSKLTRFLQDLTEYCAVAPIVEESMKVYLLRRFLFSSSVPNIRTAGSPPSASANRYLGESWESSSSIVNGNSRRTGNSISNGPIYKGSANIASDGINSNGSSSKQSVESFMVSMLAISLGLKISDNARRVLMYTGEGHKHKAFFAFLRGVFPVHELCGALTALNLARKQVLGQPMHPVSILGPAILLHSMANFRGMKPIFKWASRYPWIEMQLQAINAPDNATAFQLATKGVTGFFWYALLFRIVVYLMNTYFSAVRQARLRYTFQQFQQEINPS